MNIKRLRTVAGFRTQTGETPPEKRAAQKALYANRRRVRGRRGRRLQRCRGEVVERSFAHMYETGGIRRVWVRGHENVRKRVLIQAAACNIGLLLRRQTGIGTPQSLQGRAISAICRPDRAFDRPLGASDARLAVQMGTDGARRLNRSSPSCLNREAQRTDFFHGMLNLSDVDLACHGENRNDLCAVEEVELDMTRTIDLQALLGGCANDSFDDGIRIDTELEPLSGPGGPVKPAAYEGGKYQRDRRWASPDDPEPTPIVVIDNVPSQANRLEEALRRHRGLTLVPELILDLSEVQNLPAHLPRTISSLQFPHRNADAYLRDAQLGGTDFSKTELGEAIFGATAQACGALMGWFPQALLYGFWQSHLGRKRANTKHARAWVSEIVGWNPAATETRVHGLKSDPLNLSVDTKAEFDENDLLEWRLLTAEKKTKGAKKESLSAIGHGQVLVPEEKQASAAVSFARVTQRATVSLRNSGASDWDRVASAVPTRMQQRGPSWLRWVCMPTYLPLAAGSHCDLEQNCGRARRPSRGSGVRATSGAFSETPKRLELCCGTPRRRRNRWVYRWTGGKNRRRC